MKNLFGNRPIQINLGSGKDYRPGWLNIDLDKKWAPDIRLDLSKPLEFPLFYIHDNAKSVLLIEEGITEKIVANDVLEHVVDLPMLMTNCLKLLENEGTMQIHVPYDLSLGAWQDPTHVRAFNEMSWKYYTDWYWYLGWKDFKFELEDGIFYFFSSYGEKLAGAGTSLEDLLCVPRAIDSMRVNLKKVKV